MWIFLKFLDAYITAAKPNHGSVAGGRNKNSDFPIYGCDGNAKTGCNAWHKVKSRNREIHNDQHMLRDVLINN